MTIPRPDINHNPFWEIGRPSKRTAVITCTDDCIFTGFIHSDDSERLLDVMNQGSAVDKQELPYDFVLLTDVDISSTDGKKTYSSPNCLVGKKRVIFLGEKKINPNKDRLSPEHRSHLFTPKKAIWVEICVPCYSISGQMHVNEWQRSMGAVDTNQIFLPITKTIVSSKYNSDNYEFDFLVVNRRQISCIVELGS
jgi:hypothetical protein